MAVDCSQLASAIMEAMRYHAQVSPDATLDTIVQEVQSAFPNQDISRQRVVDTIVASTEAGTRSVSDFNKRLTRLKREAKQDKDLQTAISALEANLAQGTLPRKQGAKKVNRSAEIAELQTRKRELLAALNKSVPAIRQKYERQIKEGLRKLEDGSYLTPKPKPEAVEGNRELERLRFERDTVRLKIQERIDNSRPKTVWERGIAHANSAKNLMSSGEFSGVLRQGQFALFVDQTAGVKALGDMFRAFGSEEGAYRIQQQILSDPDTPFLMRNGLAITDIDGTLSAREDELMTVWRDKIPVLGVGLRKFDRSYNAFLNSLRLSGAKALMQYTVNAEPTTEEAQQISNAVNVFTGRGTLGPYENSGAVLNAAFYSPRYQMSRLQVLSGQPLWKSANPQIRKQILSRFYARSLLGLGAQYFLYGLLFGREKDYGMTFNPLSSDFGKVRVGDTRLDPLAGLAQPIVFMNRAVRGKRQTLSGEVKHLRGGDKGFGQRDLVASFLRSKLSPAPGAAWDLVSGENMIGENRTIGSVALGMTTPMTYGDVLENMKTEQGVSSKLAQGLLAFFGVGLQVYSDTSDEEFKKNSMDSSAYGF